MVLIRKSNILQHILASDLTVDMKQASWIESRRIGPSNEELITLHWNVSAAGAIR